MPLEGRKTNISFSGHRLVGSSELSDCYVFVKPNSLFTDAQVPNYLPAQIKIALKYFYI